jgi:hypothetical protein
MSPNDQYKQPKFQGAKGNEPIRSARFDAMNFDDPAIYWGPEQYTQNEGDLYTPPEAWRNSEPLHVPKVYRFIFDEYEDEFEPGHGDDPPPPDPNATNCDEHPDYIGPWALYASTVWNDWHIGSKAYTPKPGGFRYIIHFFDHDGATGGATGEGLHPNWPDENGSNHVSRRPTDPVSNQIIRVLVLDTVEEDILYGIFGPYFSPKVVYDGDYEGFLRWSEGAIEPYTITFYRLRVEWCTPAPPPTQGGSIQKQYVYWLLPTFSEDQPASISPDILKHVDVIHFDSRIDVAPPGFLSSTIPGFAVPP